MKNVRVIFHDQGPDNFGKRCYTMLWEGQGGYRHELAKDGKPVGYRRAQVFRCVPRIPEGARIITKEEQ